MTPFAIRINNCRISVYFNPNFAIEMKIENRKWKIEGNHEKEDWVPSFQGAPARKRDDRLGISFFFPSCMVHRRYSQKELQYSPNSSSKVFFKTISHHALKRLSPGSS
jgi:hypothetical protein